MVTVSERSPSHSGPDPHAQVDVDLGSGVVKIEGLLAVEQAVEAIQRQGYVIAAVLPSEAGTPAAPAAASLLLRRMPPLSPREGLILINDSRPQEG